MGKGRSTEIRSAKGEGVVAEYLGLAIGVIFFGVGGILCLSGIGAIIGIPLIVVGILFPFLAPVLGLTIIKGQCPYCGSDVLISSTQPEVTCLACKKLIVIRNEEFLRVD